MPVLLRGVCGVPFLGTAILGKFGINLDLEGKGTVFGFPMFRHYHFAAILLEMTICEMLKWSLERQKRAV
jgi:hypothetical protein